MSNLSRSLALLAILAAASTAGAQENQVARESFPFFDRNLTVEVTGPDNGVLQVIRGGRGRIEVAAHAAPGVAAFALGGWQHNRLRIAVAGDDAVEYVLVVPEHISLHLQLPNQAYATLAEPGSATYRWEEPAGLGQPGPAAREAPLTYLDTAAPSEIAITDARAVRRLSIRLEGTDFRVGASRPLELTPGRRDRIEIRAAGEPMDLVIQLPSGTRNFTLRVGGANAIAIRDGEVRVGCSSMTRQVLAGGRQWIDVSAESGQLRCGAEGQG